MDQTTRGRYRVFGTPRDPEELLLVDLEDEYEPVGVPAGGYDGDLAAAVADLRPGYRVDATLAWTEDGPRLRAVEVDAATLFAFREGVSGLFEVALDTWAEAREAGRAVNSRVTYSNDQRPNGALYTFADQPGAQDVYREFRDGERPLDPLLERVERPEPYEVFVLRPATHQFVLVYVVFGAESVLADTVRDTYDCPRP